jgi:hypothetical protein
MGILDKIFPQNTTDEPLRDLIYQWLGTYLQDHGNRAFNY